MLALLQLQFVVSNTADYPHDKMLTDIGRLTCKIQGKTFKMIVFAPVLQMESSEQPGSCYEQLNWLES